MGGQVRQGAGGVKGMSALDPGCASAYTGAAWRTTPSTMVLFDLLDANMDAIRSMGLRAIEGARRDGVAAYYIDPALGSGLVRELPDGTRERLERANGAFVVVERHGPRA